MLFFLMFLGMDDKDILSPVVYVDKLERNHVLREDGSIALTQYIGWVHYEDVQRLHVSFWLPVEKGRLTIVEKGALLTTWSEERLIRIKTELFEETWSLEDHELIDRQLYPKSRRLGLPKRSK